MRMFSLLSERPSDPGASGWSSQGNSYLVDVRLSLPRLSTGAAMFAVSVTAWASPVAVSVADPRPMPDRWTQFVTDDGRERLCVRLR